MDIVLERVLSLIPKDKSGKYVHGEKAKFAKSVGYNDGSIVSMWENGSSVSYTKKLHQIASTYNVSVEWLEGKTDDPAIKKAPGINAEGLSVARKALLDAVDGLTDEQCEKLLGIVLEAKRVL